ncbi:MAG: hypothetical protein J5747_05800 [Spirochaetaceae bacterium]|nr:hypothetical protein [Spirochaetaceae bacterium]
MKKKIKSSILLIVSLFCILCLTSCVFGNRASGTKPTIHEVFYTYTDAPTNYNSVQNFPNLNNSMHHGYYYYLVCGFSDPDMDADKLYLSTSSSFPEGSTWTFNVNQTYADQASWWQDYWTGGSAGYSHFYLYMTDSAGNRSNVYTLTVYFVD